MEITKLEFLEKKKVKVYIDYEYHGLLYTSDIHKYDLQENQILDEKVYNDFMENTIYRRAKQKALAILKYMDRSEYELRAKLKQADYTETIIDRTIEYVKSYHYIDDARFATAFVQSKIKSKSKKQIINMLNQKGISKDMIEELFEDIKDVEDTAIKKEIRKKTKNVDELTFEQKQKIAASLYRKGFSSDEIRKYLF